MLTPQSKEEGSNRAICASIVEALELEKREAQLGLTKVFLKHEVLSELDKKRAEALHIPAIKIQKVVRGMLARQRVKYLKAAVKLQKMYRGWRAKRAYLKSRKAVILIQRRIRACQEAEKAQKEFMATKKKVALIQSMFQRAICMKMKSVMIAKIKEQEEEERRQREERERYILMR